MTNIILASTSPRRQDLFNLLGIDYRQIPAKINEYIYPNEPPEAAVKRLAQAKAEAVEKDVPRGIIIAADTIVVCNELILGKPADDDEAFKYLSLLSGQAHQVMTAICLKEANTGYLDVQVEKTLVYFRHLTPEEIKAYIATKEPFDKAGAYAIQGRGAILVEKIVGCYFNVVGLPITRLYLMLKQQGVNLLGG